MRALVLAVLLLASVAVASVVTQSPADSITGTASWYGEAYRGKPMANGQPFDPDALTAACWHLPLGSVVRVSHGERSVIVTLADRGPARRLHRQGRIIDLSAAAFARLAPLETGLIAVTVEPE